MQPTLGMPEKMTEGPMVYRLESLRAVLKTALN